MNYSVGNKIIHTSSIRRFEFCFALMGLFFYGEGLLNILETGGASFLDSFIRYFILLGSIYGIGLNLNTFKKSFNNAKFLWPLIFFTIFSAVWSINPAVTIQSLRSDFIPTTLFGVYLSIRFNRRELFQLVYISTLVGSIISIFYAVALPSIGRHSFDHEVFPGAWKGIFSHKNALGFNLAINNVCLGIKLLYEDQNFLRRNLIIFSFLCIEIIASSSMSALIISFLIIIIIWIYRKYTWKGKTTVLLLHCLSMIAVGCSSILWFLWIPIMNAVGKDPTLTGRTLIWEYLLNQRIAYKPILGYGRDTLWKEPSVYYEIFQAAHHIPSHAHNGYIDLIIDLGYSGLSLFIISLISVLSKALKLAYKSSKSEDVWPLAFIITLIIYNISESLLLRGASFTWVLYVAIASSNLKPYSGSRSNEALKCNDKDT